MGAGQNISVFWREETGARVMCTDPNLRKGTWLVCSHRPLCPWWQIARACVVQMCQESVLPCSNSRHTGARSLSLRPPHLVCSCSACRASCLLTALPFPAARQPQRP